MITVSCQQCGDRLTSGSCVVMAQTRAKPQKPYPSYALTPHPNGQWCKKIRGSVYFFGVWAAPQAALDHYLAVAADLHAGREPKSNVPTTDLTVKELGNQFLLYQAERVASGQIAPRSFEDCRRVIRHFTKRVGVSRAADSLTAADFQSYRRVLVTSGLSGKKGLGVHALSRAITLVRAPFRWAEQTGLLEHAPRWGKAFDKPSAADFRRHKAQHERKNGKNIFHAAQIGQLLDTAAPVLRSAILLGINGGFGNTDCAALPIAAVDLEAGVIDFERPKTAVRRVVPLWPETVQALKVALSADHARPRDEETAQLVFRTESGRALVRQIVRADGEVKIRKVTYVDRLGDWFDKLLLANKYKRRGIGFYTLRHTFRTWADETRDQHAIHRIMGHAIPGMSGIYIEEIGLDRLRAVVEHVRQKLWPNLSSDTPK